MRKDIFIRKMQNWLSDDRRKMKKRIFKLVKSNFVQSRVSCSAELEKKMIDEIQEYLQCIYKIIDEKIKLYMDKNGLSLKDIQDNGRREIHPGIELREEYFYKKEKILTVIGGFIEQHFK